MPQVYLNISTLQCPEPQPSPEVSTLGERLALSGRTVTTASLQQGHRKKALSAALSRRSTEEEWRRHGCCKVERHCGHLQRHSPGHEAWGCRECRARCRTWNIVWNIQEALLEETPAWFLTAQWINEACAVISEPIGGSPYPPVCHA